MNCDAMQFMYCPLINTVIKYRLTDIIVKQRYIVI